MKYAEQPTRFDYGPYVVEKTDDGWYWSGPGELHTLVGNHGHGDRPYDCFKAIDEYENNQKAQATAQHKATLPEREYYASQEPHTAGKMGFHPYSIQDKMLRINSLLSELDQTEVVKVLHFISSVLSDIIRSSAIR